jgi:hypothetical protein
VNSATQCLLATRRVCLLDCQSASVTCIHFGSRFPSWDHILFSCLAALSSFCCSFFLGRNIRSLPHTGARRPNASSRSPHPNLIFSTALFHGTPARSTFNLSQHIQSAKQQFSYPTFFAHITPPDFHSAAFDLSVQTPPGGEGPSPLAISQGSSSLLPSPGLTRKGTTDTFRPSTSRGTNNTQTPRSKWAGYHIRPLFDFMFPYNSTTQVYHHPGVTPHAQLRRYEKNPPTTQPSLTVAIGTSTNREAFSSDIVLTLRQQPKEALVTTEGKEKGNLCASTLDLPVLT